MRRLFLSLFLVVSSIVDKKKEDKQMKRKKRTFYGAQDELETEITSIII